MPLSPDHIPLPCSLKEKVTAELSPQDVALSTDSLSRETVIGYLAKSKDTDNSPLATIKRRAAKENRKPHLRPEDQAILTWICEAFDEWEEHYPLEQPLRDHIHRLLPLAIAMALKDDAFYTPGLHPLHRLLDALQNGAVGWQMRLDRAGQMLEQRIQRAVEKALDWFSNDRIDIAAITQELLAANERDAARAQRMVQRLAETEEARLKTLSARRDAARDINAGLEQYELPAAIGEFLKGPWYDSAQLVLVKHGADSREWQQMCRATLHLMESVQTPEDAGDASRDRQEQILRHLPGELRRWLLSLEHDSDATDSAIGLVEYAHLRIQHGQKLQLVNIPAIALEEETADENAIADDSFSNGDWYQFEDDEGELRAQLVLQLENGQHLLFTNFVGLKALDLSRRAFSQRISDGFSLPLPNQETFSLSLAAAAGINNEDQLRQLMDPGYRPREDVHHSQDDKRHHDDRRTHEDRRTHDEDRRGHSDASSTHSEAEPQDSEAPDVESLRPNEEFLEAPSQELSQELPEESEAVFDSSNFVDTAEAEVWSAELPDLSDTEEFDPVLTPPVGAETELTLDLDEPESPVNNAPQESPTGEGAARIEQPIQNDSAQEPPPPPAPEPPPPAPPYQPPYQPTPYQPPAAPPQSAPPPPAPIQAAAPAPAPAAVPPPAPTLAPAPPAPEQASAPREVDVPMGAWLGFHDGETPIMAKLAVFDPRRDNYIFVNRKGIAMRELSRSELRALMDQGLVDILETRSYFRDEVERAREEGE
ncbi:DUF1631 family protein [Congregibacter variabilis]|uniref:DUF1631 family protein n=1 Tax=Congregibacter variabilis TaxID=3081200 RepID=A0ABZ0HXQ8_9GAMM|nr:DUF1631 family protein [Congregibacter sp. IMCC43200]